MSIVRYVNKKTGRVALYESTSHYDPVSKQSRPIRKYLGTEDPATGELVPSSGRRGRKRGAAASAAPKQGPDYRLMYEDLRKECGRKDSQIARLEKENAALRSGMQRAHGILGAILGGE